MEIKVREATKITQMTERGRWIDRFAYWAWQLFLSNSMLVDWASNGIERAEIKHESVREMKTRGEREELVRGRWSGNGGTFIFTGWRTHIYSQRQFINHLSGLSFSSRSFFGGNVVRVRLWSNPTWTKTSTTLLNLKPLKAPERVYFFKRLWSMFKLMSSIY